MKSNHTVNVYSCGGGAANILAELEKTRGQVDPGFANINTCYIDTSRSNLINKKIAEEHLFLFEGVDGSGKVRSANYDVISKSALAILQRFKPSTFNIVVHTASGGSGSVIGPVLVSELKARGERVVVLIVGSTDTRIEIENTIKTLKSYEAIAQLRKSPVVMHYVENSQTVNRFVVNKQVKEAISLLLGLFSGQNAELDTADLTNWLEFIKFSGTPAQLVSLNFVTDQAELNQVGSVASVATLAAADMSTRLNATPAYQCVGYVPENWRAGTPGSLQLIAEEPIHFAISTDFITRASNALSASLKEVDAAFASQIARGSILSSADESTDMGLVL